MTSRRTPAERLVARLVRMPNGCLEWTGATNDKGYGTIKVNGKTVRTHRLAWELERGPIPPGIRVLHHCDNPPCCDALDTEYHLFLGTDADNAADKVAKGRGRGKAARPRCSQGHLYDEANTYLTPEGWRKCLACRRERWRINQLKRRVA